MNIEMENLNILPPSILFIDDEQSILSSLRSLFRREGYHLLFASSGSEALTLLDLHHIDIIVTDMQMPEMTGREFLIKASFLQPDSIRIILSGYEDKSVVLDTLAKGYAHKYMLKPWDDIEFRKIMAETVLMTRDFKSRKMNKLLRSFNNLPSPPNLDSKLHFLINKPESSLNEIVKEIEKNPALVAKVLQVANSIFYASYNNILSIKDAVIFIGTAYISNLVLALEIFQTFMNNASNELRGLMEDFWERSIRRASMARKICTDSANHFDPQSLYIAALFCDIGFLVWIIYDEIKFEKFAELVKKNEYSLQEIDYKVFDVPHSYIGASLLQLWNFPSEIVLAVANHHNNSIEHEFIQIIQIADAIEDESSLNNNNSELSDKIAYWRNILNNVQ